MLKYKRIWPTELSPHCLCLVSLVSYASFRLNGMSIDGWTHESFLFEKSGSTEGWKGLEVIDGDFAGSRTKDRGESKCAFFPVGVEPRDIRAAIFLPLSNL